MLTSETPFLLLEEHLHLLCYMSSVEEFSLVLPKNAFISVLFLMDIFVEYTVWFYTYNTLLSIKKWMVMRN